MHQSVVYLCIARTGARKRGKDRGKDRGKERPQRGPKRAPTEAQKGPQEGARTGKKCHTEAPKGAKWAHRGRKRAQRGPKRAQRGPKGPERAQTGPEGVRGARRAEKGKGKGQGKARKRLKRPHNGLCVVAGLPFGRNEQHLQRDGAPLLLSGCSADAWVMAVEAALPRIYPMAQPQPCDASLLVGRRAVARIAHRKRRRQRPRVAAGDLGPADPFVEYCARAHKGPRGEDALHVVYLLYARGRVAAGRRRVSPPNSAEARPTPQVRELPGRPLDPA